MKKALIVWGGWEGHQPRQCVEFFAPFLRENGFEVEISSDLACYASRELPGKDLIVQCWSAGSLSADQEKGLLKAVERGTGLAGWHGGLADSFRQNVAYQFMVGGQWVAHPGNKVRYKVEFTRKKDPMVKGLSSFELHSEQYYLHVDPAVEVLAETCFNGKVHGWIEGVRMPVVWKKRFGKGRVFYASYGHQVKDFHVPQAAEVIRRGLLWASR